MSGTSLDGIDVALITTDGEDIVRRGPSRTFPYQPDQQALLKEAIAAARTMTSRTARPGILAFAEKELTGWHASAIQSFCKEEGITPSEIDVIGFHGQTVIHRPEIGLTVQLGDGPMLAKRTGRPVIYDMRAADMAAGGQGAPLVPVYHRALAAGLDSKPVAFVNIGGVANITWIGADGSLVAFDTGPGNALLNDWCERHTDEPLDRNGELAAQGMLDGPAFMSLAQHAYFEKPAPKSLDRNAFDVSCLEGLGPADGAMTLVHLTATSIAKASAWVPERPRLWIICGGGRHNPTLMKVLRGLLEALGDRMLLAEDAGFNGDAMEAEAWAYLAVRSQKGLALTFPGTTGVREPLTGGTAGQAD